MMPVFVRLATHILNRERDGESTPPSAVTPPVEISSMVPCGERMLEVHVHITIDSTSKGGSQ